MRVQEITFNSTDDFKSLVMRDMGVRSQQIFLKFDLMSTVETQELRVLLDQFDLVQQTTRSVVTCSLTLDLLPVLRERLWDLWQDEGLNGNLELIEKHHAIYWQAGRFNFNVTKKPLIYGILNVTPDSFYDGGRFEGQSQMMEQIEKMVVAGADVIEVGGQTTRPGFHEISAETEINKIVPAIKIIQSKFPQVAVAVDTYKIEVMHAVINLGIDIINDVNAFVDDERKLSLLASSNVGLLTMHSSRNHEYENLTYEMKLFFEQNIATLVAHGIDRQRIALDQGIGYSKVEDGYQDYAMMRNIDQFNYLKRPMMIAISRKGFGAKLFGLAKDDRLPVTLVVEAYMYLHGGNILRVHDVTETVQLVKMLDTIKRGVWQKETKD
ncbi:dihydropteroate synthase [Paucilactobacillus kaifaensis]|uniref:dihydropteroate synthase n=1 Tax=Paucilactobacillus kaifaensis TaxID=2559921 RepID=UPI0010F566DD|nr:dihydropteroate synthase [Paucilactobacillus kaifaensis]